MLFLVKFQPQPNTRICSFGRVEKSYNSTLFMWTLVTIQMTAAWNSLNHECITYYYVTFVVTISLIYSSIEHKLLTHRITTYYLVLKN